MSRLLLLLDAPGLPDLTTFAARANALLAGVLSSFIGSFQIVATQPIPNYARDIKLAIDTDTTGTTITHPYQVIGFQADSDVSLQTIVNAYRAANPSFFYAPLVYAYTDQTSSIPNRSMGFLLYNQNAADGAANWQPGFVTSGGGGGPPTGAAGGDLSGTYPNPIVGPTTTGKITTALPASATVVASFPTASVTSATVELTLKKGSTYYQTTVNMNVNDGTTAQETEGNVTIGPPSGGTFDFTIDAVITGPNLTLVVTPATTGWTSEARNRTFS